MTNVIEKLYTQTVGKEWAYDFDPVTAEKFSKLILKETIDVLRQEWYALNNKPTVENESPRDVGLRVGQKTEIIVLIEKLKKHFGVNDDL